MIPPGRTIGILGGGQLGRMTALAAAQLGYRCHVFCPEPESPAKLVTPFVTNARYDDRQALAAFAAAVDVVTFEFENVPAAAADFLAALKPVHPGPAVLRISQDRLAEKNFLRSIGVATTRFAAVQNEADLARALAEIGRPAVLKTVRLGYDGKGQVMIEPGSELGPAWRALATDLAILEGFVDFACEISVILARGADGACASYPPVENRHVHHILDTTLAPAPIAPEIAARATAIARAIAEKLELVGILAVEMFLTRQGALLVNELAPRPHNSGHWTIDACVTSQFEQLVRAICGLKLGSPEPHSGAVMKNLIGAEVEHWHDHIADPRAKLHLYGKTEVSPGRKMGHVTTLKPRG
jgi:5-(carboxyamino)imidazole ribonucleotide synthase